MPTTHLDDRATIGVSGDEAGHFLQNILTTDLDRLAEGAVLPGALLSPQGKILFDFLVFRNGGKAYRLDCRAEIAEDFRRRLMLYKLRAKVEIDGPNQSPVAVSWRTDSGSPQGGPALPEGQSRPALRDLRFPEAAVWRRYFAPLPAPDASREDWRAFRIANGVAESGEDYALGDAFPHDVLLDQMDGVGFAKGCYVGQEVVSRMQHRGTARRRVLLVSASGALPAPGTELTVDGRGVGTLGSSVGGHGLAIARIDRVKAAMDEGKPIHAGDAVVTLSIPDWATFRFPEQAGAEEA